MAHNHLFSLDRYQGPLLKITMNHKKPQSIGGKVYAKIQRDRAIENYYKNPNICKNCLKVIKIKKNQKVSAVKGRKFCSITCKKAFAHKDKLKPLKQKCSICKNKFLLPITLTNTYSKDQRCPKCKELNFQQWAFELGVKTKKQVFETSKNWQSARTAIRKHAYIIFILNNKKQECCICKYKKHVNISHYKPVSSFKNHVLIKEINKPKNLMALCPTHHWEFDNDCLNDLDKKILQSGSSVG